MRLRPPNRNLVALAALACLCALALLAVPAPAGAQDDAVPAGGDDLTITSVERNRETGEITAEVIVPVALAGQPLPDDAVTVIIGTRRQDVEFVPISSDGLEVVLVIDVSGSMRGEPLTAAKAAASSFIELLPPGVDVAVVAFDSDASIVAQKSSTRAEALAAIENLEVGGDTALFDAVILAASEFSPDPSTRRVMVALSDGGDSASAASLEEARQALRSSSIEPYAVALATSESATENLEELVRGSTGRVERTDTVDALVPLYNDLATQLASRFTIRFTPEDAAAGQALMLVNANGVLAGSELAYKAIPTVVETPEEAKTVVTTAPRTNTALVPLEPLEHTTAIGTWLTTSTARNAGVVALSATLFMVGLLISFPSERMSLIADRGRVAASSAQVTDITGRLEGAAGNFLSRNGRERRLGKALERAGLALRPAEFVVLAGALAIAASMISVLLFGFLVGLVVLAVSYFVARWNVSRLARKRSQMFVDQLPATLQLWAGALRAGYALSQSVDHLANETSSPTSDEFHRLSTEVRLGRDFSESMHAMADRLDAEDFTWVVHAVDIHREVGGDLAEVFDKVHATMRDRNFIRRQVAAVSAEGRYSAYLITSLPFVVAIMLTVTNPQYIGRLVEDARGYSVLVLAGVLITIGTIWMRSLVKVKF